MIHFSLLSSSFQNLVSFVFRLHSLLVQSLLFQMETLLARNYYAGNRSKIFSLISVVKLFLKYSMCVTYLITVKLVRDENVKPRVHSRFRCFPLGGVWGHAPQENFKNEMLRNAIPAISVVYLLRSLVVYILYSHTSNIDGTDS